MPVFVFLDIADAVIVEEVTNQNQVEETEMTTSPLVNNVEILPFDKYWIYKTVEFI